MIEGENLQVLDKSRCEETQKLINKVFIYQNFTERISIKVYKRLNNPLVRLILKLFGFDKITYWIALQNESVVGMIGLYTLLKDKDDAYWLGWYCVDEDYRGKGIGKDLLDFAETKSKNDGKKYLRLYTSDEPNLKIANDIYEKRGYVITGKEKIRNSLYNCVYREKEL